VRTTPTHGAAKRDFTWWVYLTTLKRAQWAARLAALDAQGTGNPAGRVAKSLTIPILNGRSIP
jgi:hypothetical protein